MVFVSRSSPGDSDCLSNCRTSRSGEKPGELFCWAGKIIVKRISSLSLLTLSQKKTWLCTGASCHRGLLQSIRCEVLPASCSQVDGWAASADKGASLTLSDEDTKNQQTHKVKETKEVKCAAFGFCSSSLQPSVRQRETPWRRKVCASAALQSSRQPSTWRWR